MYEGSNPSLSIKIGLETHISINCSEKLFCKCKNGQTCEVCTGHPGARYPVPSEESLVKISRLIKYLGAQPTEKIVFYKKIYPYPDLWAGYQRTQSPTMPVARDGKITDLKGVEYEIDKIFLEEDPASIRGQNISHERAGKPLAELVLKAKSYKKATDGSRDVTNYLRTLKRVAESLRVIDHDSNLKSDVNISVGGSHRIEVKNVTAYHDIRKAIELGVSEVDKIENDSTYHFRNGKLEFSRLKTRYPFVRDTQIQPTTLELDQSLPITFPEVYQMLISKEGATQHLALELANKIWDVRSVDTNKYEDLLSLTRSLEKFAQLKSRIGVKLLTPEVIEIIDREYNAMADISTNMRKIIPCLKASGHYVKSSNVQCYINVLFEKNS